MPNYDRYQPPIPLDQLTEAEQDTIAQETGLTWTEIEAVMSYPTQELINHLTAQAAIVQKISVALKRRKLAKNQADLEYLRNHQRELQTAPTE